MTPTQEDREAADSGFTPENIADAEWLWTNVAVDHRKFHTLPTHHKALLCHTAQRFRQAAEERGARMALEAAAKVAEEFPAYTEDRATTPARTFDDGDWCPERTIITRTFTDPNAVATAIRQTDPAQIVKGQSDG